MKKFISFSALFIVIYLLSGNLYAQYEIDLKVNQIPKPEADAGVDETIHQGEVIAFPDASMNFLSRWNRDFGGMISSNLQNPTYAYFKKGNNKMVLKMDNKYDSETKPKGNLTEMSFAGKSPTGYFTDPRDGQKYAYIEIGDQTWMAQNLNYETDSSWWYNNDAVKGNIYGRLYTWKSAKGACPDGWHLPSDEEWKTLEMELGMSQSEADDGGWRGTDQAEKMKSVSGWNNNGNGTNSSGFNALPGGRRNILGSFYNIGSRASWWTATKYSKSHVWNRRLIDTRDKVFRYTIPKNNIISVRCIKD